MDLRLRQQSQKDGHVGDGVTIADKAGLNMSLQLHENDLRNDHGAAGLHG